MTRRPIAPLATTPAAAEIPAAAAACTIIFGVAMVVILTTFPIFDTDFWEHLLVGKAIWQSHSVPTRHLWSWPTYGQPDTNSSWGFSALVWPVWNALGIWGLQLWRWLTTLAAFGVLWVAARRMGARSTACLVAFVLCGLVYRERAQVRPETVAAVLLAVTILVLETLRNRPERVITPPRAAWIAAMAVIAWIWANVHISYFLCFVLLAVHGLDAMLAAPGAPAPRRGRREGVRPPRSPGLIGIMGVAALAACFINPFGARALWQPFDFLLHHQQQAIFRTIQELRPLDWRLNLRNLFPVVVLGWPLLMLWRARRFGLDRVELLTCALFTILPFRSTRFLGFFALVAAPYLARDLEVWAGSRTWGRVLTRPWPRTAAAMALCGLLCVPELTRPDLKPGVGIEWSSVPVAACDFIERHGVGGHGFNKFEFGGYQLYRFWPDRARLPFMDIHQSGTPKDQMLYALASIDPAAWRRLDEAYRFDYAVVNDLSGLEVGRVVAVDHLVEYLDSDSTWRLVLFDDASRLYVRNQGAMRPVALEYGCRILPGASKNLVQAIGRAAGDSLTAKELRLELERQATLSPYNSSVTSVLSFLAQAEGRASDSRALMQRALRVRPGLPRGHEWLGRLALLDGQPALALEEFAIERAQHRRGVAIDYWTAVAYQQLGAIAKAIEFYDRAVRSGLNREAAAESLDALRIRRVGG